MGTLAITSCGEPPRAPHSNSPLDSKPALPNHGAPRVPNPIDVSKYKSEPCTTLTTRQLQTLGLETSGTSEPRDPSGPQCTWNGPRDVKVNMVFIPNPGGLSDLYAIRNRFSRFSPQPPINGFPSVLVNNEANQVPNGICAYQVGINDHDAISLRILETPGGDPCGDAKNITKGVTRTIRHGGQ
ncbi:DUF3558 family protein [Sciscionella sediminilitoris]|uniref:DUF3558 family protein n=1 Tax=Sciscionella sediminilitoris TaxID=1445613 RepID=UPI0009E7D164